MTNRGDKFSFFNSGFASSLRIVISTTESNMTHLNNSNLWIVDGTFKVVPKDFYQSFIIYGKIFGKIFTLIYVFMGNKYQNDYENLLSILINQLKFKFPDNITLDFEIACYKTFKKAFKNNNIFCLFVSF